MKLGVPVLAGSPAHGSERSLPRASTSGVVSTLSWRHGAAPWIATALVVVWSIFAMLFNTAQFGDNIEQFNWAHSPEWGYHKHPPMPTWLLGTMLWVVGPSPYAAIALAAICFALTGWFTWSIACELMGRRAATAVILLWGLQQSFSVRAQLYNHNTALVLFIAATAWAALQARRHRGWWSAVGLCAGAALLSKYQAIVPLAGVVTALVGTGVLRTRRQQVGFGVAVLIAASTFAPHVAWVANHDFTTLRYAGQSVEEGGVGQRFTSLLQFFANQVRMLFPMLLAVLAGSIWIRYGRRVTSHTAAPADVDAARSTPTETRVWLFGLVGLPLGLLVVLDLLGGVSLRNQWGVQTMQFVTLYIVHRWQGTLLPNVRRLALVVLTVQLAGLGLYVRQHSDTHAYDSERRLDSAFPARRLADAAVSNWSDNTSCPLRYVAGDSFPAGLISLYAGGKAAVFEGSLQSPWVDPDDMRRSGAIVVVEAGQVLPPGLISPVEFRLSSRGSDAKSPRAITLAVRPPEVSCD